MNKILIANRGEIAVRIIRACKEMNIKTVAVYSEIDKDAMHTKLADEAICIGPASSNKSYLNFKNIIEAAHITGADGIHTGFVFLSENSQFTKICEESNIKFIGPKSQVIELLGNKSNAKKLMESAGVPVIPGSKGSVTGLTDAIKTAEKIGYPVMLKAAAGGGGKGIRIANNSEELEKNYNIVKQEAKISFNDDEIYMEKFIKNPRHVEIQILADEHGNVIHLGERDCSIQRRNQKMMEESPSKALSQELREKMGNDAIKAAKKVGYVNAGTIEFVLAPDGKYYFIEMNTRIQVEHPVTEMVTGVDLVREQIRIAAHLKLNYKQSDIELKGHALECRINAENPQEGFRPSPGIVSSLHIPGGFGVRIDTTLYQGYQVSSHYDSMIAKVIVHGRNRIEAIRKMRRVLSELVIDGIDTNQELQYLILHESDYVKGNFDTSFIEKHLDELVNER